MSGGQNGPRKFSEKIAIMERKLNEDEDAFSKVMREVREITSTTSPRDAEPIQAGLHPGHWHGPGTGGSLPNMHEASTAASSNYWPAASPPGRGRSPGSHYHPYRAPRSSQERVPPLHGHVMPPYDLNGVPHASHHNPPIMQQQSFNGLSPPSDWGVVNRAHSAPSIHMLQQQQSSAPMSPVMSPYTPYADSAQQSPVYGGSPVYNGSTGGSPVNLLQRPDNTIQEVAGSLPNIPPQLPQMPGPSCYHAQVGQRHSTGGCGTRLAPSYTPESQSAPTSPALMGDNNLAPAWPNMRHYSNSPEALDIPNIVLTEADGLNVGMNDCFDPIPLDQQLDMGPMYNTMQDLTLDNNGIGPPHSSNGAPPQQYSQQMGGVQMVPTSMQCNGPQTFSYDAPPIYR
ncbi:hypothetical protein PENTCL1PPCAC_24880 [Pristionchus entomophagus]|uniref:Transducer of regulated CREB activity N-terminal domain-containing protein n=1 Tax=Pristionchus entomophagus TaxID=358040 RepID=A0AAV5U8B6_9BILA|nr:hypothetical protein PENTCL1PPCAC_24880 [Pristionchus entomophagus]